METRDGSTSPSLCSLFLASSSGMLLAAVTTLLPFLLTVNCTPGVVACTASLAMAMKRASQSRCWCSLCVACPSRKFRAAAGIPLRCLKLVSYIHGVIEITACVDMATWMVCSYVCSSSLCHHVVSLVCHCGCATFHASSGEFHSCKNFTHTGYQFAPRMVEALSGFPISQVSACGFHSCALSGERLLQLEIT